MFDNFNLCDVHERIDALEKSGVKARTQKAVAFSGCNGCSSNCSGGCGGDCSAAFSECVISI